LLLINVENEVYKRRLRAIHNKQLTTEINNNNKDKCKKQSL